MKKRVSLKAVVVTAVLAVSLVIGAIGVMAPQPDAVAGITIAIRSPSP